VGLTVATTVAGIGAAETPNIVVSSLWMLGRVMAEMKTFTLDVLYAQLAVFDSRLEAPFNTWSEAHIGQGFSWRTGSVSFQTLEWSGSVDVQVADSADEVLPAAPTRIIAVPFTVPAHGEVEVASVVTAASTIVLHLEPGEYALTFGHGLVGDDGMWVHLAFRRVASPIDAAVVLADAKLSPPPVLLMSAAPA
jgi:hypothetical protein